MRERVGEGHGGSGVGSAITALSSGRISIYARSEMRGDMTNLARNSPPSMAPPHNILLPPARAFEGTRGGQPAGLALPCLALPPLLS